MKKKIFIFGYTGYIGSYLLQNLKDENFETHGIKISRPKNGNLYEYYKDFINKFLSENDDGFCIINSAGSISCLTNEDYFFNAKFDVIFQKILKEKKINIKYLSFNSTKVFTNGLDNYTLSKRDLNKNFINYDMCYSLYIDLVFDDDSPHFKTIQDKIKSIKINLLPVFNPGKNFYPINLNSLADTIKQIINNNYEIKKFIIIGDKKINFCDLIKHVNSVTNLNKKILYISSKLINYFPKFIKKILLKSKTLQQFDDYNWLENINANEFLIRKINNKF